MAARAESQRLGRLERSALTGVLVREVVNFSSYWRSTTFSSTVEPTIYLLAFGFGFGSLVSRIGGYRYVEFVGTGTVATAVLFSSAFPAIWLAGFGWACFGIMVAGFASSFENFNYIVSAVLTPLFLVAGTFFPLSRLPGWAQDLAQVNPLHHCVELVRHAVFGFDGWTDLARVGVLIAFGLLLWRIAIHAMERKLID